MSRAHKMQLYRVLRYFLAECGWLMFIYEWIRVSRETPGKDQITLVFVLVPSLLLIHAGVSVWIAHNKSLAANGKRGLVTRYISPAFSRDHLGRQLIMESGWLSCSEIVVSIDGDSKCYTPRAEVGG